MKNSKKGISLIVLVITIIVIIILAAAVVMSLNNNNVLTNSRRAVNESDFSEVEGAWNIACQSIVVKQLDLVVVSGEITSAGFTGRGYAGELDETKTFGGSGDAAAADTLSTRTNEAVADVTIASLDLPSTFTNIAIADNRVVALVKNGQLMQKVDGVLSITEANFTGNMIGSAFGTVNTAITTSKAYVHGGSAIAP